MQTHKSKHSRHGVTGRTLKYIQGPHGCQCCTLLRGYHEVCLDKSLCAAAHGDNALINPEETIHTVRHYIMQPL